MSIACRAGSTPLGIASYDILLPKFYFIKNFTTVIVIKIRFGSQETSAFEFLYDGQFTLSTQLIKPSYLVILPTDAAP